eukprot:TRINITY_DN982_c0_g4_i3.p2 TRINITY_DN982_c0_g4~~TRINITY_DN982_c0_g4_i3.p2  ORF type:complete len:102 (+),score=40.69 TRINITY_DN982_c0_g4_i3:146-451(+)
MDFFSGMQRDVLARHAEQKTALDREAPVVGMERVGSGIMGHGGFAGGASMGAMSPGGDRSRPQTAKREGDKGTNVHDLTIRAASAVDDDDYKKLLNSLESH